MCNIVYLDQILANAVLSDIALSNYLI